MKCNTEKVIDLATKLLPALISRHEGEKLTETDGRRYAAQSIMIAQAFAKQAHNYEEINK